MIDGFLHADIAYLRTSTLPATRETLRQLEYLVMFCEPAPLCDCGEPAVYRLSLTMPSFQIGGRHGHKISFFDTVTRTDRFDVCESCVVEFRGLYGMPAIKFEML